MKEVKKDFRKTSLVLVLLALLVASPSNYELAFGGEKSDSAAIKTQAPETAFGPDSQDSPVVIKEKEAAVSEAVMTALSKIKKGQGRSGGKEHPSSLEVVTVTPGRNVTIAISGKHLNRIITPFEKPAVNTVKKVKHQIYANALYVSLGMDDGPAALFITEDEEENSAISLTLEPKDVPPREVRLKLDGNFPVFAGGAGLPVASGGMGKAAKWEKTHSYVEAVEQVLLRTARGEVPPGYNLREFFNYDPQVTSHLPVVIEPRQVLEGHHFLVVISRMTNRSSSPLLINEESFYRPGVRAVSVWPRVRLEPGQTSELYVVFQRSVSPSPRMRPSVLGLLPGEVSR